MFIFGDMNRKGNFEDLATAQVSRAQSRRIRLAPLGGIMGGICAVRQNRNFWTGKLFKSGSNIQIKTKDFIKIQGYGYGMSYDGPEKKIAYTINLQQVEVFGKAGGGDLLDGIVTLGFTGTLSIGIIGFSFEIGIAFDGKNKSLYFTLEHAVGADLSFGGSVNYYSKNNGNNLSFSEAEGCSESYNGSVWIFDGSYGGNSINSGLNPKNYSDYHQLYLSYGFGISASPFPLGFTINKGYTWYFLEF